jgi:hypothetical protein
MCATTICCSASVRSFICLQIAMRSRAVRSEKPRASSSFLVGGFTFGMERRQYSADIQNGASCVLEDPCRSTRQITVVFATPSFGSTIINVACYASGRLNGLAQHAIECLVVGDPGRSDRAKQHTSPYPIFRHQVDKRVPSPALPAKPHGKPSHRRDAGERARRHREHPGRDVITYA